MPRANGQGPGAGFFRTLLDDFTDALRARSDLRASLFTRVRFVSTDLSGADLRQSTFENCVFIKATMAGAASTPAQGRRLPPSARRRAEVAWTDDEGPEPPRQASGGAGSRPAVTPS